MEDISGCDVAKAARDIKRDVSVVLVTGCGCR
jgi:hypothetical protein